MSMFYPANKPASAIFSFYLYSPQAGALKSRLATDLERIFENFTSFVTLSRNTLRSAVILKM